MEQQRRLTQDVDLVDSIEAVGSFLKRFPFSSLLVCGEAVLLVVALGVLPDVVSTVLGFPTYPVHLAVEALGRGVWWGGLLLALVVTLSIDGLLRVLSARLRGR